MEHTHEVVRPIVAMDLKTGDKVDASGWRNVAKMVDQRYLRPVESAEVKQLKARISDLEQENKRLKTRKREE